MGSSALLMQVMEPDCARQLGIGEATVYMMLRMRFIGLMVLGLILGLAIIAGVGYFYISLGYAPVGTAAPPFPFEKTITSMALNARIKREAPAQAALPATDDNLIAGARAYSKYCAACHGFAGQPETEIAKGMFPKPPQLFNGHAVSDDPIGETYWKIENGIRLTGVPAFHQSLSENQIWQIALLLANAEKLPAAAKTIVSSPAP
jgi:thiosulfate dehydrogenase